jgi:hypothetical protein
MTAAITEAEITDARLDAISYARDVLERARTEHGAWHSRTALHCVTAAMAALRGTLRSWDRADSGDGRDEAARMAAHWSARVVAVIEDVIGPEAAAYVRDGDDSSDEGEWAA